MIGMPFNFQLRMIDYWFLKVLENTVCLKMQYTTEKEFNSFWQNHFNSCKKEWTFSEYVDQSAHPAILSVCVFWTKKQ